MEVLREKLSYNDRTGELTWKVDCGGRNNKRFKAGDKAGCLAKDGYVLVGVNKILYKAHRVAWFLHYGEMPSGDIDHINHIKNDNRISNLRVVTAKDNNKNQPKIKNNTGYTNVYYRSGLSKPYRAGIRGYDGKKVHLGYFGTAEEASIAVKVAKKKYGYHENHGE
ncbi:HNH nuclease [Vibrio phage 1.064.O._10N.261.52.E2]|nr:HNH nuclease [Vibrio phage 1.064.O._10N.261.52.E2]AUR88102.1 HNH nuclease [Vibrio phage 1.108.O._10N.222.51.A4]